jgi:protein-disulfide isomerase
LKPITDEKTLTLPVGQRDHVRGSPTAGVTLLEYGDYEYGRSAQACAVVKSVLNDFSGQIRFVFRNFPVGQTHPHAQHAAEAAEAAGAQNRFWEMHDALFEHQTELADGNIVEYAVALGVDPTRFLRHMSDHIGVPQVWEDFISGLNSGVNGTPTFFINGERHNDDWDADSLLAAIRGAANGRAKGS